MDCIGIKQTVAKPTTKQADVRCTVSLLQLELAICTASEATRHLIALGHTGIAITAGRTDLSVGVERIEGFRKAMQEAGLPVRDQYFQQGDFSVESGYRCGAALLRLPEPPTAIFSCNNKMSLGLMQALSETGVRCPEEVSVLAFDDFPWTSYFRPRLTAVAQPSHELGRRAMEVLLKILDHEQRGEAELRIRESTAPPRGNRVRIPKQGGHRTASS